MNILITGATSGIGKACAVKFAMKNNRLFLTGRRNELLKALQNELKLSGAEVYIYNFDIRDQKACNTCIEDINTTYTLDVLINNAGLAAGMSDFANGDIMDWELMIDTNIKGLMYITRAVLPKMIHKNHGHIINIGSTAAKHTYAKGNIYCATKHAIDALSQGLRIELLPHNIKVTAIHPGMTETEFALVRYKGDAEKASKVYENITPLYPEDIADVIYYAAHLPAHVCLNDIVVTCTAQANAIHVHRYTNVS